MENIFQSDLMSQASTDTLMWHISWSVSLTTGRKSTCPSKSFCFRKEKKEKLSPSHQATPDPIAPRSCSHQVLQPRQGVKGWLFNDTQSTQKAVETALGHPRTQRLCTSACYPWMLGKGSRTHVSSQLWCSFSATPSGPTGIFLVAKHQHGCMAHRCMILMLAVCCLQEPKWNGKLIRG